VNFSDFFIKPNYSANLTGVTGSVSAITRDTAGDVDLRAKIDNTAPVEIMGKVNPLAKDLFLDIKASAHDIELAPLTPYAEKYAGYGIEKGKLSMKVAYKLENRQLTAQNNVILNQLTFGAKVDSPTATKLPVRLAIALLKNSRGEIDVNVPVSGSLSDPQFSLGSLIWGAVANLLQKAVTAPFALLTSAFGSEHAQELGYVEFDPGSAQLTEASRQKLETLSKALNDKPQVKVDLIGRVDPQLDEPALRTAYVDRLVRQQKVRELTANGASVDPRSVAAVTPEEYGKYLTMAYKDSDVKKERNLIGMVKAQPPEQLRAILAAQAPINESSLRDLAQRRAAVVQQWFDGKVDAGRIYTVAPKLTVEGIQDKGATTRVDFGVK
jgi:outer membrane protein OmpA-like peptidoglycan-associated protein